jgi:hypoxanthine phosphoribosyltransferase
VEKNQILLSEPEIAGITRTLARQIAAAFAGRPLQLLGLLRGCQPFMADLSRELYRLNVPLTMHYVQARSYVGCRPGDVVTLAGEELLRDLRPKTPLLVLDDVFDTGATIRQVASWLAARGFGEVKVCVLLQKKGREDRSGLVDFCGAVIPDVFVVGYGLDYNQQYRELPFIMSLPPGGAGEYGT